jgi:hypothetical protein
MDKGQRFGWGRQQGEQRVNPKQLAVTAIEAAGGVDSAYSSSVLVPEGHLLVRVTAEDRRGQTFVFLHEEAPDVPPLRCGDRLRVSVERAVREGAATRHFDEPLPGEAE